MYLLTIALSCRFRGWSCSSQSFNCSLLFIDSLISTLCFLCSFA